MAHVLIIDDDQDIREALRLLLQDDGHAVSDTASPAYATHLLLTCPDSLVVLFDDRSLDIGDHPNPDLEVSRLDDLRLLCHGYICMSTNPAHLDAALWTWLVHHSMPVIAKPFDMYTLLTLVTQSVASLCLVQLTP